MSIKKYFANHKPVLGGLEILKYIGPGLLVTVGFIDPGNWASNIAAGSQYGYTLLWMVTLSTVMLIALQHNAAHLGIATGLCLSEASTKHLPGPVSKCFLGSAVLAAISTALAEVLGAAIGLNMLFGINITVGTVLSAGFSVYMLISNNYRRLEKWIIGFVSLIGISFLFELSLIRIEWGTAFKSWVTPSFPEGSMTVIMSVLGAVVMPHNLFLHSEIIQSRQWNLESEQIIRKQLKYEFLDTLFAMIVGWAINSAMILVAAAVFYASGTVVTELQQAEQTLRPLLGRSAAIVFGIALLLSGLSSSITAAMAGGSIFAGIYSEPFDIRDNHSRMGILITLLAPLLIILFLTDPYKGIIWSQIMLSIQLPLTIFGLIWLTSSKKVMGKHANIPVNKIFLLAIGLVVSGLNVMLLMQILKG